MEWERVGTQQLQHARIPEGQGTASLPFLPRVSEKGVSVDKVQSESDLSESLSLFILHCLLHENQICEKILLFVNLTVFQGLKILE